MQVVIPLLLKKGHDVLGVDNLMKYGEVDRKRDYEFIKGDLTDVEVADKSVKGVDGVLQAAATLYGVGGYNKYPADILAHDVTLHQNVLWSALKHDVEKVCFTSSSMVYEASGKLPSSEDSANEAIVPQTDYGLSKLIGERLSKAFARQYGLKYCLWRPFNILTRYEAVKNDQGVGHVFADYIQKIIFERQNPLPIIGDGTQIRCFGWIEEVAQAIAEFSFDERTDNEVFNLGNSEPVTMKMLANLIYDQAQKFGMIPLTDKELDFKTIKDYKNDVRVRIPDVSKAKLVLGWEAKVKLKDSIRMSLEYVKTHVKK